MPVPDFMSIIEGNFPYAYKPIGPAQVLAPYGSGVLDVVQWPHPTYWSTDINGTPDTINVEAAGENASATVRAWPNRIDLNSGGNTNDKRNLLGQEIRCENTIFETRMSIEDLTFSITSATTIFAFDNLNTTNDRGVQFTCPAGDTKIRFAPSKDVLFDETLYLTWTMNQGKAKNIFFRVFPKMGVAACAMGDPDNIICYADTSMVTSPNSTTDWTDCSWRIRSKQDSTTEKNIKFTKLTIENFA